MPRNRPANSIQISYGGRSWSGQWSSTDGVVYVSSSHGSTSERSLGHAGRTTAERLLRSLVISYLKA